MLSPIAPVSFLVVIRPRNQSFVVSEKHVITRKANTLPSQRNVETMDIIKDLHLADKSFGHPGSIDMLIGVELMNAITTNDRFQEKSVTITRTMFGWVITGREKVADFRDQNSFSEAVCKFLQTKMRMISASSGALERCHQPSLSSQKQVTKNYFEATKSVNGRF